MRFEAQAVPAGEGELHVRGVGRTLRRQGLYRAYGVLPKVAKLPRGFGRPRSQLRHLFWMNHMVCSLKSCLLRMDSMVICLYSPEKLESKGF